MPKALSADGYYDFFWRNVDSNYPLWYIGNFDVQIVL